ncbi:transglutaminase domain-containing protein [Candidatus Woesearchaeota archaeon]|jgi:transglutaminase-like putative cysteine protease|nr:transglutaminase domain-containing protein [Candidatus Woesearchaeota archaeon]MBT5396732.1 transglutaminase domain-containing protein [Candidatus Woesearchaeota archaeon]MBT6367481.1 transglutaminase domain-containing protein [Candidatus Woesearchaeota archaeon]MBT7762980.1 transglutaminase domain-containing protein [Candidatus Woesearchaeota archaeon]
MNKVLVCVILLLCIQIATAEIEDNNLYLYDSLEILLNVDGGFKLTKERNNYDIREASTELLLYPKEDYRQSIQTWDSTGIIQDNGVMFTWNEPSLGDKEYGYTTILKTENQRKEVQYKVPFPIHPRNIKGYEEYLEPTITIDSNNPEIVAKATELAQGEDDLFKVAFKLAEWVERNVEYDLNTLTSQASQKASWVLENEQGVCDEMTSLFVAMARSLGIPARFVSGISYTTSELFDENWQPHGWAEVFFPDIGWVSFDITFGEYGYIDVTHIKLRDGFDPAEPATKFEWLASNVLLTTEQLSFNVNLYDKGTQSEPEILVEQEILSDEIGFGSYNLVKGIIKNNQPYYTATTVQLAVPEEIEIIERNKRTILLHPHEVRETYWIVKLTDDLDSSFLYTFPTIIYSEKNVSVRDSFNAQALMNVYEKEDIETLTIQDEERSYSRKVSFECDYPTEIKQDEENNIECSIKNSGNTNLENVNFCVGDICNTVDLPINQKELILTSMNSETVGWNKIIVSAKNNLVEKKSSFEYGVTDIPKIEITTKHPERVHFGETINIPITIDKISFSTPKDITIIIDSRGFENRLKTEEITQSKDVNLELTQFPLRKTNSFTITAIWYDAEGKFYSENQDIVIIGEATSFSEKVKLFLNRIIPVFS